MAKPNSDEDEPKGPDFSGVINGAIERVIESIEWDDYEIVVRFRGRKVCRGYEAKNILIQPKRRQP